MDELGCAVGEDRRVAVAQAAQRKAAVEARLARAALDALEALCVLAVAAHPLTAREQLALLTVDGLDLGAGLLAGALREL